MKGTVETITKTRVIGPNEDSFDVVIKFEGQDDTVEFRTLTYEERYACIWAKPGQPLEIDLTDHGRLRYMQAQFFKYANK